jgi:hypothetical protein
LRPTALVRNLASVGRQTAVERLEQLVFPDHVGDGLADGLFGRIPWYAPACRGTYVAVLSDDDVLAGERVVEDFIKFATRKKIPPVIVVDVLKNDYRFPIHKTDHRPIEGEVDMGSYILRRDVWLAFADKYGRRYAGDADHAQAVWDAGHRPVYADLLFATGPAGNGVTEISL